jgi:hypothetical protein
VNETVVGLFKLTKVDRIVKLYPTAREAAQAIAGSQSSAPA